VYRVDDKSDYSQDVLYALLSDTEENIFVVSDILA